MIHQIETLRAYISQNAIPGGIAYGGHAVHFWITGHKTYCGKSNLVRRDGRVWSWNGSICKKCLAEIEALFVASLAEQEIEKDGT